MLALLLLAMLGADPGGPIVTNPATMSRWSARYAASIPSVDGQCSGTVSGVTCTRASNATCTKTDGTIAALGPSTCRLGVNGLLEEGAATNVVLRSEEFNTASWSKLNSGATAPVVTADQATAPVGSSVADRIAFGGTSAGTDYSFVTQSVAATAAAWSASVYLKGVTGAGTLYLSLLNGSTYHTTTCAYVLDAWTRCTLNGKTLTAAGWFVVIGVDRRDAQQANQPAQSVYVWGAQAEAGAYASSYLPTEGTTTARTAEIVSAPNRLTSSDWCIASTIKATSTFSSGSFRNHLQLGTDGSANSATLQSNTSGALRFYVYGAAGTAKICTTTNAVENASARVVACSIGGTLSLYRNGSALTCSSSGTGTGVIASHPATMYFGANAGGGHDGFHLDVRQCKTPGGCL